jgi:hypothetical protein
MSTLAVNTITAETGNTVSLASGKNLYAPGSVVQIKEASTGTSFTTTSTTIAATNLSQLITPKFQTSKFYIAVQWNANVSGNASAGIQVNIYRSIGGATATAVGDEAISYNQLAGQGTTHRCEYTSLVDTPNTTSQISYQFWAKSHSGTSERIAADWGYMRMTVMEVAQ